MRKITQNQLREVLQVDNEFRCSGIESREQELGTIRINSYYTLKVLRVKNDSGKEYYAVDVLKSRHGESKWIDTHSVRETLDRALLKILIHDLVDKYELIYEEESKYAHIIDLYEILDPEDLYNEYEIETQEEFIEYFLNNKDEMLYNLIYMLREERGA